MQWGRGLTELGGDHCVSITRGQIDAMISDNDSDNFKYHDDEERRELSCNDGITVIHSLNQTQ